MARWISTSVLIMLLCAAPLGAAIPGAADPKVVTEHAFRAALLDFNRRTSVETYKAVGKRDPKWDQPAVAFLEVLARYFANSKAADRYRIEPAPTLQELEAQARALISIGCDDPLVIYGLAVALDNQDKRKEARPLLQQVLDELPTSRYPITRLSGAAHRMLKFYDRRNEQELAAYERCEQMLLEAALASISVADVQGIDRRAVLFVTGGMIDGRPMSTRKRFATKQGR